MPAKVRASVRAFRGFFLADPEDLSVLPLVEQFADRRNTRTRSHLPDYGRQRSARHGHGQAAAAARCCCAPLSAVPGSANAVCTVTVEDGSGRRSEIEGAFLVCALPASTARDVVFEPRAAGTAARRDLHLRYGAATRLLLQFDRRFWKQRGRPIAFGTDLPIGAIWDGNEQQRGPAILSFLAGGRASSELQQILRTKGRPG